MKALILNSGTGSRMGLMSSEHPKCMTQISAKETILSRQLNMLAQAGICEVIMTTGPFESELVNYCQELELPVHITYVKIRNIRTPIIFTVFTVQESFWMMT